MAAVRGHLDKLPARGNFLSSRIAWAEANAAAPEAEDDGCQPSSSTGGASVVVGRLRRYVCDHATAPPGDQRITTDSQNILIRSLLLRKKQAKRDTADVKGKGKQKQVRSPPPPGGSDQGKSTTRKARDPLGGGAGDAVKSPSKRRRGKGPGAQVDASAQTAPASTRASAGTSKRGTKRPAPPSCGSGRAAKAEGGALPSGRSPGRMARETTQTKLMRMTNDELKSILLQYGATADELRDVRKADLVHRVLNFFE